MSQQQEEVDEEIEQYRISFNHFDKDGNGSITMQEFGKVFQALGQNPTKEQISQMIKSVDKDENGRLSFDEFVLLMRRTKNTNQTREEIESDMCRAFKIFDKNGNGYISRKELSKVLKGCGESFSDEEVREMMNYADVNQDGKIDYEEFVKKMADLV